ncbi:hypothetical protein B0X41_01580 [Helicobacter pylori]|uniref:Uncharacterized protein n=1 Tax=Helicobacter pylori TaxID=210 RepID=A0AB36KDL4_HELPX|nr:hypothetical protein B0X41_01580 [Helicobacter pylori]
MQSISKKIPLSFNRLNSSNQESSFLVKSFLFDSSLSFKVFVSFYLFIIFELIFFNKGVFYECIQAYYLRNRYCFRFF